MRMPGKLLIVELQALHYTDQYQEKEDEGRFEGNV